MINKPVKDSTNSRIFLNILNGLADYSRLRYSTLLKQFICLLPYHRSVFLLVF